LLCGAHPVATSLREGVFSAKGAPSSQAWGNAPGVLHLKQQALKARFTSALWRQSHILGTGLNRAFGARLLFNQKPGALPQALN
jgi:hypothetical protein